MQVRLKVLCGAHAGKEIRVPVPRFLVGRGEQCHLRPASDVVSRQHCAVIIEEQRVLLQDFGSKNGTYVNGERIEGSIVLQPGDHLQVGPLHFEVLIESLSAKRPQVRDVSEAVVRAAQNALDDEDEITSWLEGPADPEGLTQAVDSRVFKLEETQQLDSETAAELSGLEPKKAADSSSGVWKRKDQPAQKAQGLPKKKPLSGSDSREAAAETLRKFFSRR